MTVYKSNRQTLFFFFQEIEQTYDDVLPSILKLINEGQEYDTSYLEVNFVLKLIAKLRVDFNHGTYLTSNTLEEMLKGGHLKFKDEGSFYRELVTRFNNNLHKRTSSHNSCEQQYSFSGPVVKEVLFGVSVDKDGNQTTWIQFEKHNTRNIINLILHLWDYLVHKFTGKNVGPFGLSDHTEDNPLVLSAI